MDGRLRFYEELRKREKPMLDLSKTAFSAFWFEGLDTSEKISRVCEDLASIGYKGVEWKETCFGTGFSPTESLRTAVQATRKTGLEVTDFVILRNLGDPETAAKSAEEVCEFVRASAAAGVGLVNTGSVPVLRKSVPPDEWWKPSGPDWEKSWTILDRSLSRVLNVAEREGVTIIFEAIVGSLVCDYYSICELLRRMDSPSLALTIDPSHYLLHDNDIGWTIRQLKDKVRHVHVKDAAGRPGVFGRDFLFPILGEGAIDWTDFFVALDDIGYQGWLALEFESFKYMNEVLKGDALEAATITMRSYRELCDRLEASSTAGV